MLTPLQAFEIGVGCAPDNSEYWRTAVGEFEERRTKTAEGGVEKEVRELNVGGCRAGGSIASSQLQ